MNLAFTGDNMEKVRFIGKIAAWLLLTGVAYGMLKSDVNTIKDTISGKVVESDKIHSDHEVRLRSVEEDRSALKKDVEYMKQSLDRIEKKLDRRN